MSMMENARTEPTEHLGQHDLIGIANWEIYNANTKRKLLVLINYLARKLFDRDKRMNDVLRESQNQTNQSKKNDYTESLRTEGNGSQSRIQKNHPRWMVT